MHRIVAVTAAMPNGTGLDRFAELPGTIGKKIPTLDRSGAEKQLTLLATGLPRAQFDVHVVALTRGGREASGRAHVLRWSPGGDFAVDVDDAERFLVPVSRVQAVKDYIVVTR